VRLFLFCFAQLRSPLPKLSLSLSQILKILFWLGFSDAAESLGAGEFTTKFGMVGERALMIRTECRIFFSFL
jgi:hypothetical protein